MAAAISSVAAHAREVKRLLLKRDNDSSQAMIRGLPMSDLLAEVRGCTFDDFLFAPRFSVLEPLTG